MVEQSLPVYKSLFENKNMLNAQGAEIVHRDALQFLARNAERFDVILLDPPFNQGWLPKLLPQLAAHLSPDGMVYAEAEFPLREEAGWQVWKHGKAGNVHYHLLKSAHAD